MDTATTATGDRPSTPPSRERPSCPRVRARTVIGRLLLVPLVVLALFGAGIPLYVTPPIDPIPEQADAVFVLGPSTRARVEFARRIITSGATDTMVLSVGPGEMNAPYEAKKYKKCNEPGGDVLCYSADPLTTQGEARQLRDMAEQYGWDHVIVITNASHLVRAEMIIERCYSGELSMVPSGEPMGLDYLVNQYVYQTGAFLKAFLVTNGC